MLALYYSPGACSLASQIALQEAGADYEPKRVDFASGQQRSPEYLAINPHGRVPALVTDGRVITEGPAILSYVGERFGEAKLLPESLEDRAFVRQMLAWLSATVHTTFAHVFRPERYGPEDIAEAIKAKARETLEGYFTEIDEMFAASEWLSQTGFTVADGYPFVFYRWAKRAGFDLKPRDAWTRHVWRMLDRPAVERALSVEGLPRTDWIETV